MDLGARIGWGIVIYAIGSLAITAENMYAWTQGPTPYLANLLVLIVVCVWAGSELTVRSWKDILPYSIGWAVIAAALDAFYAVPLFGWEYFDHWEAYVTYALIALLPLLAILFRKRAAPVHGP